MELRDINQQLEQARADARQRDHARQLARDVQAQLDEAWGRLDQWSAEVEAAEGRREDLEGLGMTGLFARILGTQREKAGTAHEELLRCKLRRDAAQDEVAPLQARLGQLRILLEQLEGVDLRLEQALDAKASFMLAKGGEEAQRIVEAAERIGVLDQALREIDEAIVAGIDARRELDEALSALGSARSWGQVNTTAGGWVAASVKHSRIDRAQTHISRAQRHLRRFISELQDVDTPGSELKIKMEGFDRFADTFFDCLITDWRVQSKIISAQERTRSTRQRTSELVHQLERRRTDTAAQLTDLRAQRDRWIENG